METSSKKRQTEQTARYADMSEVIAALRPIAEPGAPPLKPNEVPAVPPAAVAPTPPQTSSNSSSGGAGMPGRRPAQPLSEYERRSDELIELVTSIVKPDSWDDVGGPGAIDAYNGLIVVAQTAEVHQTVERLFDMLREAAGLEVKTGKVVRQ